MLFPALLVIGACNSLFTLLRLLLEFSFACLDHFVYGGIYLDAFLFLPSAIYPHRHPCFPEHHTVPKRIRQGSALNVYDRTTFYTATIDGGSHEGYTDYPNMAGSIGVPGRYKTMKQNQIGASLASSLASTTGVSAALGGTRKSKL